jgi:hypothetical protein
MALWERHMITETRKVFAVAALIVATGVAAVELTRSPALAESAQIQSTAVYAASRINGAFDLIAAMPPVAPVRVPMAIKGDLPVPPGCLDIPTEAQAECMDVAYEVPSESVVVETRFGNTSILMRMDALTVADVPEEEPNQHNE